jgi:hypothetical protein
MLPILLIDGNNLGHVLGYINKTAGRYDSGGLLACLDSIARYLEDQGQKAEIVLFLDDAYAMEHLGGWHVQVASVPNGDADAAISAYAQAHADHPQILVSGDQALCGEVAVWGVVCLSPQTFISHYLIPAHRAGSSHSRDNSQTDQDWLLSEPEVGAEIPPTARTSLPSSLEDRGEVDRQRQMEALERAEATLRGEPLTPPEVYRLNLSHWDDATELSLYLAEQHLCPNHPDLTKPSKMIDAIREHCSRQPRYFTAGRVINRVFRLLLCRPEHSLALDDLARLAKTRRRKIRAAINKHGERLGIVVAW